MSWIVSLLGRETLFGKVRLHHPARLKSIDELEWFICYKCPIESLKSTTGVVFGLLFFVFCVLVAHCPTTSEEYDLCLLPAPVDLLRGSFVSRSACAALS